MPHPTQATKLYITYNKRKISFFIYEDAKTSFYKSQPIDDTKSIADNISLFFANHLELHKNYASVYLILMMPDYSIVPNDLENTSADNFMSYNNIVEKNTTNYHFIDSIKNYHCFTSFVVEADLLDMLGEQYENVSIKHASSVFLSHIYCSSSPEIHIYYHEEALQICVFKKGKLFFYNLFSTPTKEDFMYYILETAEQLELNLTEVQLYYYGLLAEDSAHFKMLNRYISHILPGEKDQKIRTQFLALNI